MRAGQKQAGRHDDLCLGRKRRTLLLNLSLAVSFVWYPSLVLISMGHIQRWRGVLRLACTPKSMYAGL